MTWQLPAENWLARHRVVRTACGRELDVGRLALGDAEHPAHRVTMHIAECDGCDDGAWASLTVGEARRLANALLTEAAATQASEQQAGAGRLNVAHVRGVAYEITTRDHTVVVDQPVTDGGSDTAATPTELFVASLASCVAYYAGRYLARHGLGAEGLAVRADFTMAADRPARVASVRLRITVPSGLPDQRRAAFLAVVSHCTVHNTLQQAPAVSIDLA